MFRWTNIVQKSKGFDGRFNVPFSELIENHGGEGEQMRWKRPGSGRIIKNGVPFHQGKKGRLQSSRTTKKKKKLKCYLCGWLWQSQLRLEGVWVWPSEVCSEMRVN